MSMNNLANSLSSLGRREEALKLREETQALQTRVLPKDHPDIADSMKNLASSMFRDNPKEALKLVEDALALQKRVLPKDHPDIADSMFLLALHLGAQQRYKEALTPGEEALTLYQKILPNDHPSVVRCEGLLKMITQNVGSKTE